MHRDTLTYILAKLRSVREGGGLQPTLRLHANELKTNQKICSLPAQTDFDVIQLQSKQAAGQSRGRARVAQPPAMSLLRAGARRAFSALPAVANGAPPRPRSLCLSLCLCPTPCASAPPQRSDQTRARARCGAQGWGLP